MLLRDGLAERAARVGAEFLERLGRLVGRGGLVAVRGVGLLLGLEFADASLCARFARRALAAGLILNWTLPRDTVVRLAPPLTLAPSEADSAVTRIAEALGA